MRHKKGSMVNTAAPEFVDISICSLHFLKDMKLLISSTPKTYLHPIIFRRAMSHRTLGKALHLQQSNIFSIPTPQGRKTLLKKLYRK